MTIQGVARSAAVLISSPGSLKGGMKGSSASLLPEPSSSMGGDPVAQLYAMLSQQQETQGASDQNQVLQQQANRKQELAQESKSLAEEQKDADHGGHGFFGAIEKLHADLIKDAVKLDFKQYAKDAGNDLNHGMIQNSHFWTDLGKVAETAGEVGAIVGGAALTVVTGGAAGVVMAIGVALSVSALADQQTHFLQKMGVSDKAAGWIDIGVGAAGAVLTGGAAIASSASTVSSSAATFAKQAETAGAVAQGASAAIKGGTTIRQGFVDADAEQAQADEVSAQQAVAKSDRVLNWLLDSLQEGKKSLDAAKSTVQSAIETQNSTSLALASFGKA